MTEKREHARDMAEKGRDKLVESDTSGETLIDKAKTLDPGAVQELAREVRRDKEHAERFKGKG